MNGTPLTDLLTAGTAAAMMRKVRMTRSHFFDPDTMRWFGTTDVTLVGGCVVVATDSNAPKGYPRHWAAVFRDDGEVIRLAHSTSRARVERYVHGVVGALASGEFVYYGMETTL